MKREALEQIGVRRSAAERARVAAKRYGMRFCDYATACVEAGPLAPREPLDPLGAFLRAVLDAVWTDHFRVGLGGLYTTPEEYAAMPDSTKRFVTEITPDGDILRVKVVSKEWAMRMAVERVAPRDA